MTDRVGPDQAAANEELSAVERLALMQAQHRLLDQKIIDMQNQPWQNQLLVQRLDRKSTRLNSSHVRTSRMPSSA